MGKNDTTTTQHSTQTVSMTPQQQQLFDSVFPIFQQYAGDPGLWAKYARKRGVVKQTPQQGQARRVAMRAAKGPQQDLADAASKAAQFLTSGDLMSPDANPWLQSYMDAAMRPITENFRENVIPSIASNAEAVGGYGSSRQGVAEGIASGKYMNALGDTSAQIGNNAYNQGLSAYLQGMNFLPTAAQLQTLPSSTMAAVGEDKYNYRQRLLDDKLRRRYAKMFGPFLAAKDILGVVQGIPGSVTTGDSTSTVEQPDNTLSQILGGGLSILSLL